MLTGLTLYTYSHISFRNSLNNGYKSVVRVEMEDYEMFSCNACWLS